jgi:peptide/nickel transport system permease protein
MDRILQDEEAGGAVRSLTKNRALSKALNNKMSVLGGIVFLLLLILCYGAPLFTRFLPTKINLKEIYAFPSWAHLFGTDCLGRDVFSRVLYGGRMSIAIGFGSALGATFLGTVLGCWGGYKGGVFDAIVLRLSELFLFFPQTILCLIMVSMVGQSISNLIIIFIITGWCSVYRMARSQMLSLKEREFVQALRVQGIGDFKICFKHILPNALGPLFVNITLTTATYILQEAALSYLGLGVPLEVATWGNVLNVANNLNVLTNYWWIWLPVGIVISLFVLSINFIGDGLRDSTDSSQQG